MKPSILPLILISLVVGFALLQPARAVVPLPDGGYPGGNTAEGQNALFSLTDGTYIQQSGSCLVKQHYAQP